MTNMADFNMSNSENAVWEVCPHSEFCGGCIYQGVSYADQLAEKEKQVKELNRKIDQPLDEKKEYRSVCVAMLLWRLV